MANAADQVHESEQETRRAMRTRTFLQARIRYGDGAISADCTVNQLSDVGARINIADSVALPDVFEIEIPQRGINARAKLVWRKDDQVGVEFIGGDGNQALVTIEDHVARIKALTAENAKLRAQIAVLLQQVHRLTEE